MTTAYLPIFPTWYFGGRADAPAAARKDPPVSRSRAPVFIHDAVIPFGGETLLLFRLRADLESSAKRDAG